MAFFQVAAVDLDGTLTSRGRVSAKAVKAIDRARGNGLVVVLATGRIGAELAAEFPDITDHFDALVLENGAVVVTGGRAHRLMAPVDRVLDDALAGRGVPFRRGEVLLAIDGEHAATVVDVIGMLGLDCQIVRNRGALMVLPAGVTKGTGLGAVLTEMNLSLHNTVAVGDAENDLSLFGTAEIGAAVVNAVPSVREHADLVLEEEDGAGIAELLAGPYVSGARRWCPPRWWLDIGTFDDGTPVKVPGSQARILVTGPAGSGKSYVVGLLAEQWIQAGYCVLLLDPEGDHVELQEFNQVQLFDARHHLPEPDELVSRLHPQTSVVVDLSVLAGPHKADYLHRMRSAAVVHREAYGFPHWVIYDEAHLLGSHEEPHWTRRGGYVLSSLRPASLAANEIDETDVVLTLENPDTKGPGVSRPLRRASVRFGAETPRSFTLAERRTAHVRHRHKYAEVSLPRERRFFFRPIDGQVIAAAGTMGEFRAAVSHLDPRALWYHLARGDFSRWLDDTIADKELASQVAAWEDELLAHRAADLERVRRQLVEAVDQRYLALPDHD